MNGSNVFLFHDRVFKKVAVFFCCSFHFPKLGWDCNDQSDFQKPGVEGGNASISLDSRKIMWHRTACDLKNVTSTIMWQGTKPWLFFFFCLQSLTVYTHLSYLIGQIILPMCHSYLTKIYCFEWMKEWMIYWFLWILTL